MPCARVISPVAVMLLAGAMSGAAIAALPPLTPAQDQAAALKKQQAAAQADTEKQQLAASMDKVAGYWKNRAAAQGWEITTAAGSVTAAAGSQPPAAVRSEKLGTAPPSEDVKNPAEKGK